MKFFRKLVSLAKKAFRFVAGLFKDKNPVEVVNDVAKTAAAVATAGVAIYTGVNAVKAHLIPAVKKNRSSEGKSAHDLVFENREAGSVDEKFAKLKKSTSKIGKKKTNEINNRDLEVLEDVAKTRNSFFQSLSPEEQMNVLEMEEFDFKEYSDNYWKKNRRPLFPWGKRLRKLGVSPTDEPFREPVDYGFFNFILRPLDDFIHWLKNDPVPKKIPQVQVFDHPEIPAVECETAFDMIDAAKNLDSYISGNKAVSNESTVASPAALEAQQIVAEEVFRHKTLKKFKKAVNRRMAQSQYNTPNIFDLMDDDDTDVSDKKKKKKKDKDKKKKSHDCGDSFASSEDSGKKKKKHKEDREAESDADKRAQELYKYHLEVAMSGKYDRKGYKFGF